MTPVPVLTGFNHLKGRGARPLTLLDTTCKLKRDKTVKAQQVMAREVGTMMIGNVFLSKVFVCSRDLMGLKYRVFCCQRAYC